MGNTRPGKPTSTVTRDLIQDISVSGIQYFDGLLDVYRRAISAYVRLSLRSLDAMGPAAQPAPPRQQRHCDLSQRIRNLLEDIESTRGGTHAETTGVTASRDRVRGDAEQIIALTRPLLAHEPRPPLTDRAAGKSEFSAQVLTLLLDIKKARGASNNLDNGHPESVTSGQYLELLLQLKRARETHGDNDSANG